MPQADSVDTIATSGFPTLNDLEHPATMLANGADLLAEMLCQPDGKFTESEFNRIFYVATKVRHDAAALRDLTIEAVEAAAK